MMKTERPKLAKLFLKDIGNIVELEYWLKEKLSIYPDDKKISPADMKVFVDYIKGKVESGSAENKLQWFKSLSGLSERLKSEEK